MNRHLRGESSESIPADCDLAASLDSVDFQSLGTMVDLMGAGLYGFLVSSGSVVEILVTRSADSRLGIV